MNDLFVPDTDFIRIHKKPHRRRLIVLPCLFLQVWVSFCHAAEELFPHVQFLADLKLKEYFNLNFFLSTVIHAVHELA